MGSPFKAVHEYLETLYDALADVLDSTAKLLKMNGEMTFAGMKKKTPPAKRTAS